MVGRVRRLPDRAVLSAIVPLTRIRVKLRKLTFVPEGRNEASQPESWLPSSGPSGTNTPVSLC
jgi:hypothetical protein